jgi:hypothetical protein
VILWEHFGYRCPDVYIYLPDYLIVIEVKEHTRATSDQIVEQYNSAKKYNNVAYFLLTNNEEDSQAIAEAKIRLKGFSNKIEWVKWTQVWKWLREIQENPTISSTDQGLLIDLIQLLEVKGMKDATEIKYEWFTEDVARSLDKLNKLYREICLMVLKLRPKLDSLGLQEYEEGDKEAGFYFELPNKKASNDIDKHLVPSTIEMLYRDKKWKQKPSLKDACIDIVTDLSEPSFSVGFCLDHVSISDEDWDALETVARQKGLDPLREPSRKGTWDVGIWRYLIGGGFNNGESKEITFEELENSLKKIRDFAREYYGLSKRQE